MLAGRVDFGRKQKNIQQPEAVGLASFCEEESRENSTTCASRIFPAALEVNGAGFPTFRFPNRAHSYPAEFLSTAG